MEKSTQIQLPYTLLELLSNTLVLDGTLPYLPLSTIFRLSQVSKAFKDLVFQTPRVFRYLDLSKCRAAYVAPTIQPIDSGGQSWRAHRMDENLTEDEFLSGPLRGVISKLSKREVMKDVQTLVLDGLGSVTSDLLSDILLGEQYSVRLLSVIGCLNLNQRKFQSLLSYLCRPTRPDLTPKLRGVYVFGTNELVARRSRSHGTTTSTKTGTGITTIVGAQLGAQSRSETAAPTSIAQTNYNPWFLPSGAVLPPSHLSRDSNWETTLTFCAGLIAFDAVLCTHMHQEMAPFRSDGMNAYLNGSAAPTSQPHHGHGTPGSTRPLAAYALSSTGCAGCGKAPAGSPTWGDEVDLTAFPLVHPPPFSGRLIDAVRPPPSTEKQRLIVSCAWCLSDRHCQSCHRWWCGLCYDPANRRRALQLEAMAEHEDFAGELVADVVEELKGSGGPGSRSIKVYNGLCTQFCAFGEEVAGGNGGMWG
jgi:hypothetical protein